MAMEDHPGVDSATAAYLDFSTHQLACLMPSPSHLETCTKLHAQLGSNGLDKVPFVDIFSGFTADFDTVTCGGQRRMLDTSETKGLNASCKAKVRLVDT